MRMILGAIPLKGIRIPFKETTSILYNAAGQPPMEGSVSGVCRTCGEVGIGILFDEWVKDTFTNFGELAPGEILCKACQFAFDEHSELLAKRVGKDSPQRMRNYSHFVVGGEWIPLSKGNKAKMRDILLNRLPDMAVIAVSGQKHIIFRARHGWWQIEESSTRPFMAELKVLIEKVEELYNGGISKGEIESGRYNQRRILDFGLERWREIENDLRPRRGSLPLQLAVFLAQHEEGYGQVRNGDGFVSPDLEGDTSGLQTPIRLHDLATVRGQRSQRGLHVQHEQIRQYDLFAAPGEDLGE